MPHEFLKRKHFLTKPNNATAGKIKSFQADTMFARQWNSSVMGTIPGADHIQHPLKRFRNHFIPFVSLQPHSRKDFLSTVSATVWTTQGKMNGQFFGGGEDKNCFSGGAVQQYCDLCPPTRHHHRSAQLHIVSKWQWCCLSCFVFDTQKPPWEAFEKVLK